MQSMPPQCPPWTLHAWPPLLWQLGRPVPPGLQHLGTQVTHTGDPANGTAGQTLWACQGARGRLGMAWDWVQLQGGVVAMADPMAVLSNLRLVGDEGELLTPYASARHLCTMVHALPWQPVVAQAVEQALERAQAARAAPAAHRVRMAA